jgi:hypothetical protein
VSDARWIFFQQLMVPVDGIRLPRLASMEMRLVYEEWHKRIPDYGVVPGTVSRVR